MATSRTDPGPLEQLALLGQRAGRRYASRWLEDDDRPAQPYRSALEVCTAPSHSFGPVATAARRDAYREAGIGDELRAEAEAVWREAFEEGLLSRLQAAAVAERPGA